MTGTITMAPDTVPRREAIMSLVTRSFSPLFCFLRVPGANAQMCTSSDTARHISPQQLPPPPSPSLRPQTVLCAF
ncbi:unnamed protein product [Soboliphyme baturini]|uniref:Uncharacterized protein n=1 Tax=Soboliphyme baturini TaxID=241478 RepID=A0A183IEJ3_9BILA|nr:unnamed protein product [Soboliphyme baturini]